MSAFVTPDLFLQYTVMPFGLRNAPTSFQCLVNMVLVEVPHCSTYLDDAVTYSLHWSSHLATLTVVFEFCTWCITDSLNLAKCEFAKAVVKYLGHQVGRGKVRPLGAKISVISAYPAPSTCFVLQHFLGMAGYYRSFFRDFSAKVSVLTSLLSPKVDFCLDN